MCVCVCVCVCVYQSFQGRLGSLVGQVSYFPSGHDLAVRGFGPSIRLCADSLEPGACFGFCASLFLCPSPAHMLSHSLSLFQK